MEQYPSLNQNTPDEFERSLDTYDQMFGSVQKSLQKKQAKQAKEQAKEKKQAAKKKSEKVPEKKFRKKEQGTFNKILFRMFVIFTIISFFGILLGTAFFASGLDREVFGFTFEGTVVDETGEPLEDVLISSGDSQLQTGETGTFSVNVSGDIDSLTLNFTKEGFNELTESISINRELFVYSQSGQFTLISEEVSEINGSFIPNTESYDFADDSLIIDGKPVQIRPDGTFTLEGLATGTVPFSFESDSFVDIEREIEVVFGENELEPIELEPAGAIEGKLTSFVKETEITEPTIFIENVFDEQIIFTEDNRFLVKNLTIDREYNVRISAEGYVTRDYTLSVKQGLNQLPNFRFVEEGTVVYVVRREGDSDETLYSSEFDGINEARLLDDFNLDPENVYHDAANNIVYFQTDIDRVNNPLPGGAFLVYQIDLVSGQVSRVTTDTTEIGRVVPNYEIGKFANVYRSSNSGRDRIIQYGDLDGTNRTELMRIEEGEIHDVLVSNDGNNVYYDKQDSIQGTRGLYRINVRNFNETLISERASIDLLDSSDDGSSILFTARAETGGFTDLFLYNSQSAETRMLQTNVSGRDYTFLTGSNSEFIYWQEESGRTDIFKYDIESTRITQLTRLSSGEPIRFIDQQGDFVLYYTNRALYVMNPDEPHTFKRVTTGELEKRGEVEN